MRLPKGQAGATHGEAALLVTNVAPDGPAAAAGVLIGDIVLALDGTPVASPEDLLDLLTGARVGRTATLASATRRHTDGRDRHDRRTSVRRV